MRAQIQKLLLLLVFSALAITAWGAVSEYSFTSSQGTFSEISGGTVHGTAANDNECFLAIPLGFTFTYNGVAYNTISIATNGFIAMGDNVVTSNVAISSATGTNNVVAALNRDIKSRDTGSLMSLSSGTAPNRVFTVQWLHYKRVPTATANDDFSFQIQLLENGNKVQFVYGAFTAVTSATAASIQVGLRGDANTDFNNRTTTTDWSATTAGTANNSNCTLSAAVYPANGLTFTFQPAATGEPPLAAQNPNPANNAINVAIGANLSWTTGGGTVDGYKVYLGTDNPPTNIVNGTTQTGTSYDPANFAYSTVYYWKIVPYNTFGDALNCPVWSFTTLADPTVTTYPYAQNFDTVTPPGLPMGWTTINANTDAYTWESYAGNADTAPNSMRVRYNTTLEMNDWLVSPPLVFTAPYLYKVKFYYRASSATYPEKLSVYYGNAPTAAAMTNLIYENLNITNVAYEMVEVNIPVATSGTFYIGFWGHSAVDMFYLYLDTFSVAEITESLDPPTDLAATIQNNNNVHLTWDAPGETPPPNNDWLITPQIAVTAGDVLKFWAKSYTAQYGLERFKVGVSTTGTAPANFTIISGASYIQAPVDWTEYTYPLAAYAGQTVYIGIQCLSNDAFIFLVDDVFVGAPANAPAFAPVASVYGSAGRNIGTPVPAATQPASLTRDLLGYKVYRDGTLIATIPNPATLMYDDLALAIGTYSYTVTAYYDGGESVPAGPVSVQIIPPLNPPTELTATVVGNDVTLNWVSPETPPEGSWITWSQDVLGNSVGTNSAANFDVAHRWPVADIAPYAGQTITQVKFVPAEANCVYTIKIWTGGSAAAPATLVHTQEVVNPTIDDWNLVVLNTPVVIPANSEVWVGYNCNTQGGYPAGCDNGPQIEGKGNMMYFQGTWSTLTALAPTLTYNWTIQTFVQTNAGLKAITNRQVVDPAPAVMNSGNLAVNHKDIQINRDRALAGFKVYRDGVLIGTINNPTTTTFVDLDLANATYVYGVSAVYTNGESAPATVNAVVNVVLAPAFFTENYETYPDFATLFAPWTLLDVDQSPTYGIQNVEFPGSAGPMAFIVFNPSATTPPVTTVAPHGGAKMAASFASVPPAQGGTGFNNDYMITPRVHLGTNSALKFYARSMSSTYLEDMRVGVSTIPTPIPQGFQNYLTGAEPVQVPAVWTEYVFDLSAYDGQSIFVCIRNVSEDEFILFVDDFSLHSVGGSVNNEDGVAPAIVTELKGNYPNPFNPETTISYSLQENIPVNIEIYNVKGQKVKTLVNEAKAAGNHSIVWKGLDDNNRPVSSGVYFFKMNAGKYSSTKKMIMMK